MRLDAVVVAVSSICGAFCRSLTGFGGSILFELVYNLSAQANVAGLEDAVLMVSLGCVFEIFTSTVLLVVVAAEAARQWRLLLCLSALSLPATVLGAALLMRLDASSHTLIDLRLGLNVMFLVVSMYKLTGEMKPKVTTFDDALIPAQKQDPVTLFRQVRFDMIYLGFVAGFLNGLIGLPGPAIMSYFATAMSSGKVGFVEGYAATQGFFMLTTLFRAVVLGATPGVLAMIQDRWTLFAMIPLPSLLSLGLGFWARRFSDPITVLRAVLVLLLMSSLVGTGALTGTPFGTSMLVATVAWAVWLKLHVRGSDGPVQV